MSGKDIREFDSVVLRAAGSGLTWGSKVSGYRKLGLWGMRIDCVMGFVV